MRAAIAFLTLASLLAAGCSRPVRNWDDYPGDNLGQDLRAAKYEKDQGHGPLPMSTPPAANASSVKDAPWRPAPVDVNPVNPGVTPVEPSRLAAFLPAAPEGWTAEEPNGVTLTTPQGVLTESSRSYWKGAVVPQGPTPDGRDMHASVGVSIVDRGQTGPELGDPTDERRGVKLVPVQVGAFSGDEFDAGPAMKQVQFEVGRFLVRVRGGHVTLDDLRGWAGRMKLDELAKLN